MHRRSFLTAGLAGTLSFALSPATRRVFAAEAGSKSAEACILIFLEGGPSHIDMFDPKPGTKTGGPFQAIDTAISGVKFTEHFPKLAKSADKLAIVRSLHSREGDHDRAVVLLHTGYSPTEVLTYPSLGAMVAHAKSTREATAPAFVAMGDTQGPGFLGPEFAPHVVNDVSNPANYIQLPDGFGEERMQKRLKALDAFNAGFAKRADAARVDDFRQLALRADRLRKSPALQPWDSEQEKPELRETYGFGVADGSFARNCLAARRMVEQGAKFVEVRLGGWDTHEDNFNQVQNLAQQVDAGISALIQDLSDRGLLQTTLVVCVGEFGRTPQINGNTGRDHWADAFSALVAGGPLKVGQVIGATDEEGAKVKDRPVSVPDLFATLLAGLGIDPAKSYKTPDGRPIKLTKDGQVIKELL